MFFFLLSVSLVFDSFDFANVIWRVILAFNGLSLLLFILITIFIDRKYFWQPQIASWLNLIWRAWYHLLKYFFYVLVYYSVGRATICAVRLSLFQIWRFHLWNGLYVFINWRSTTHVVFVIIVVLWWRNLESENGSLQRFVLSMTFILIIRCLHIL